jgi:hypothetical protein
MPYERSNVEGYFGVFFILCGLLGLAMVATVIWAVIELVSWGVAH